MKVLQQNFEFKLHLLPWDPTVDGCMRGPLCLAFLIMELKKLPQSGILESICCCTCISNAWSDVDCMTAVEDPDMRRDGLRVSIQLWNKCNMVTKKQRMLNMLRITCFERPSQPPCS